MNRWKPVNRWPTRRRSTRIALIQQALKDVKPAAEGRRQKIDPPACPSTCRRIWVDADMARRVLINLMENAIKFTPGRAASKPG